MAQKLVVEVDADVKDGDIKIIATMKKGTLITKDLINELLIEGGE